MFVVLLFAVAVHAVEETAKLQTNLTKELFEDQDVTTVPARSSNDTVIALLSMTLLKVVELVWTQKNDCWSQQTIETAENRDFET